MLFYNMKNHFFFPYAGNKRDEVENLYKIINLENKEIIVEPFCGSSAFSYYLAQMQPKKFKYILNDKDSDLIELYKVAMDDEKREALEKKINEWVEIINKTTTVDSRKEAYKNIIGPRNTKDKGAEVVFFGKKYYNFTPFLANLEKNKDGTMKDYKKYNFTDIPIYNFLKNENVEIRNDDGVEVFKQYENNEKALIFLDPPYISTSNAEYGYNRTDNKIFNIYEYLYENDIYKLKAAIYLIVEACWINRLLFKGKILEENNKKYNRSQIKKMHLTISNESESF
jgi:hypothetical protein